MLQILLEDWVWGWLAVYNRQVRVQYKNIWDIKAYDGTQIQSRGSLRVCFCIRSQALDSDNCSKISLKCGYAKRREMCVATLAGLCIPTHGRSAE